MGSSRLCMLRGAARGLWAFRGTRNRRRNHAVSLGGRPWRTGLRCMDPSWRESYAGPERRTEGCIEFAKQRGGGRAVRPDPYLGQVRLHGMIIDARLRPINDYSRDLKGHESPTAPSTAQFKFRTQQEDERMGTGNPLRNYGPQDADRAFDLFICHAAEDKEAIARPLKEALEGGGWSVWFDEAQITVGDSLREKLDEGLREARFGVVILSPHFFEKPWPQVELDALMQREVGDGRKVILPVWHEVDEAYVAEHSPTLVGKYAARSAAGVQAVVSEIERAIGRPDERNPSHEDRKGRPVGGEADGSRSVSYVRRDEGRSIQHLLERVVKALFGDVARAIRTP